MSAPRLTLSAAALTMSAPRLRLSARALTLSAGGRTVCTTAAQAERTCAHGERTAAQAERRRAHDLAGRRLPGNACPLYELAYTRGTHPASAPARRGQAGSTCEPFAARPDDSCHSGVAGAGGGAAVRVPRAAHD